MSDNIFIMRPSTGDPTKYDPMVSFSAKRKRDALKQARAEIAKLTEPDRYTVFMMLEEFEATSGLVINPTRPAAPRKTRKARQAPEPANQGA
jgi:hypothetical protein